MSLQAEALGTAMIDAARAAVANRWPALRALAEVELKRLAQVLVDVEGMLVAGEMDVAHAQAFMNLQKRTVQTALQTIRGIGTLTARDVTTAAAVAVGGLVNRAVGFKLL